MGLREAVTDLKEKATKPPEYQIQKLEGLAKLVEQNNIIIKQNAEIISVLKSIKGWVEQ